MTETPHAPPPGSASPAPPPPRPPLRRSSDDRVLGGVCGGVARYLGVDPVLVRVVVVVLALFGGGGVLVYLAAWLLIPEQGRERSAAQQLVGSDGSQTALIAVIAVVVALALALSTSGMWFGMGPDFGAPGVLLLFGAVALVVWLVRRDEPPVTQAPPPHTMSNTPTVPPPFAASSTQVSAMTSPTEYTTAVIDAPPPSSPGGYLPPPQPEPVPPPPPKQRSVLGLLTASAAAFAAGILITIDLAVSGSAINSTTVLATTLAVVGIGLLVGAFIGRSRGLIALGIALALATSVSAAVHSVDLKGGVGERTWHPTSAAAAEDEFRLGLGEATLDLRDLPVPAGGLSEPITASVGIGELNVYVPRDVDVEVMATAGLGDINVPGRPTTDGSDVTVTTVIDAPDTTDSITLDLEVGLGEITVRETAAFNQNLFPEGAVR